MSLLDIIAIGIMAFFILKGIFRGLIREIASFVGIVMGIWMACMFYPQMAECLKAHHVPSGPYLSPLSFVVILTMVVLVCSLLGWLLKLLLRKTVFGWSDHVLGAGFAAVKGGLFIYVAIILLTLLLPAQTPLIAESKTSQWVISSSQSMLRFISPELYEVWKERITEKAEKMTEVLSEKIEDVVE
ncbi:MAG: CvpA family protein [Deltaproteobacteria bacterium]|nr:CvpA family protein [Deltaproteobacteria bacterium]